MSTGDGGHGAPDDFGSNPGTYYAQALADGIIRPQENIGAFRAQMLGCLSGKVLRIDPLTGAGVPSNPFYSAAAPDANKSKVWALGLRQPFRMVLKPGTGSTNPADGNPGTLYIGDVGYFTWEEVDVVDRPGLNMGWPLFEGLEPWGAFPSHLTANQDAPNPLFNVNGCTQQFFNFQDLLRQATLTGTASFPNPCDNTQAIPATVPTFVHTRPLIDWKHVNPTGPSRTGIFSGGVATTIHIGAPGSPVAGTQFGGSASVGGVFYNRSDFPAPYQNTYFFGDYSYGWLRNMTVDAANKPTAVRNFIDSAAVVVYMTVSPNLADPGLYYVNFFPAEIRKITYTSGTNLPPVARASSDKKYGPSPLVVQFTGSTSSDPEGQPLTYLWNFGDGMTSTAANPAHTFTTATTAPVKFTVSLTVKDNLGNPNQTTLLVSANNTPPQVTITSPAPNTTYSVTANQTTYNLWATVIDAEQSGSKLACQWQTVLHHNTHEHPEPVDTTRQTTTVLLPYGCGPETYYYVISLTVTDAAGLATTKEVRLDPNCTTIFNTGFTLVNPVTGADIGPLLNGAKLNLNSLRRLNPSINNLNIRASTNLPGVSSMALALSGAQTRNQIENAVPYSLFGSANGNYNSWTPPVGAYSLTATPWSGTGTASPPLTAKFSVVDPAAGSATFYRALNLNGPALTLDGNAWEASAGAANFATNGATFVNNAVPLVPATDAARAGMIHSSVWQAGGLTATFSAVPAGACQVYVYVWEDNNAEVYGLALNGQTVLSNYNSRPAGTWKRLGPYAVSLAVAGTVQLVSTGTGAANFSGIELWKQGATPAAQGILAAESPAAVQAGKLSAQAHPNPSADGRFVIELSQSLQGIVDYTLLSPMGAVVATGQQQLAKPATFLPFDFSTLAAGMYYLRLESPQHTVQLKLLRE